MKRMIEAGKFVRKIGSQSSLEALGGIDVAPDPAVQSDERTIAPFILICFYVSCFIS